MTLKTFKRYENKYLLQADQYQAILKVLPEYMKADAYSKSGETYPIFNIYYDTDTNEIIRNSLSKPYYKEKLRLRSYSIPTSPNDKVFLELKKKIGGVVSKRRATMTLWEATRFVQSGIRPSTTSDLNAQVVEEIAEFLSIHPVSPKAFISYDRLAFFGKDDKQFRVTFDSNIQTRRSHVALKQSTLNTPLLENAQYLMEVKIIGAVPLWLAQVLSEEKVYSTSFSKYGAEYKKYCVDNRQSIITLAKEAAYLYLPQRANTRWQLGQNTL